MSGTGLARLLARLPACCPFNRFLPHRERATHPAHQPSIQSRFFTQFSSLTFWECLLWWCHFVAHIPLRCVYWCILAVGEISPRRRAAPAHIPHWHTGGNQFGNALLLLTHPAPVLLHLLLLHHQSPPSGFANPLTGSKSESLMGIQQIKICLLLPDHQCPCLHSVLVWGMIGGP